MTHHNDPFSIVQLDSYAANPGDLDSTPLSELGHFTAYPRTAPHQVVERAKEAHALLINKVVITEEVMAQLPHLRYIGVLATGYNVVDVEAAHRRGIVVTNIPAYSTNSVAQHTFALILALTNRVEHYAQQSRSGRWSRNPDFCYWDTPLTELAGKTLGLVGLGNIGMRVATIAQHFGMDVYAVTSKHASDLPQGIQKATLTGLLGAAHIVSLHCPLTSETHHLINAENIGGMREGALLINTGRGPLVDEEAVAQALHSGRLGGYGADVMEQEPPQVNHPLWREPCALITPHIAWATREARERLMKQCVENLKAFLQGQPIHQV